MRFPGRQPLDDIEAELVVSRPEPEASFVKALQARVTENRRRSRIRTYARVSFAAAITALMFGALASFGGIGYAASSTVGAVNVAKRAVSTGKPKARRVVTSGPAHDQYKPEKVTICHTTAAGHGVTISISRSALPAHLAHGDTIGPCRVETRVTSSARPSPTRTLFESPAAAQYKPEKVTLCHRTQSGRRVTITISRSARPGHLAHGDTLGRCPVTIAGTVGRSSISLKRGGAKVTKLKAGVPYRFVVKDQSSNHNFRLTGPGVNKVVTGVGFTGTRTVTLKLRKGTYRFVSDGSAAIHGSFRTS